MRGRSIDILRRFRLSRKPTEVYQQFNNYDLVVGAAVIPLSPAGITTRFTCKLAILQADLANAGVINIGGPMTNVGNGIQLAAGVAILLSASTSATAAQRQLMGGIGMGLLPYIESFEDQATMMERLHPPQILIDLHSHFCVATAAGQILRVMYTQETEG